MKIKLIKISNRSISFVLMVLAVGLVCLNACKNKSSKEYDSPSATFKVNGRVSDQNNNPIPNIRVVFPYYTAYTDVEGKYLVKTIDSPTDKSIPIQFIDIDNVQNGEFKQLDTVAQFINPTFTGGDGNLNAGETEIVLNVKLKPLK